MSAAIGKATRGRVAADSGVARATRGLLDIEPAASPVPGVLGVALARATRGRVAGSAALARATRGRVDIDGTPTPPTPPVTPEPGFQHSEEFRIRASFKTRSELPQIMRDLRLGGGWRRR